MEKKNKIKSTNIIIRVREHQKTEYEAVAEKEGKFLSEWIRDILDREAQKSLKEDKSVLK